MATSRNRLQAGKTNRAVRLPFATGFTLLEVMVALAVFAIAAVALVQSLGSSARNIELLEQRQFAGMVAHNRLVAATLSGEQRDAQGESRLGGRDYRWQMEFHETEDSGIYRVEVRVRQTEEGGVLAERIGFLRRDG